MKSVLKFLTAIPGLFRRAAQPPSESVSLTAEQVRSLIRDGRCDHYLTERPVRGSRAWVAEEWTGHWAAYPDRQDHRHEKRVTTGDIPQSNGDLSHPSEDDPLFVYYRATFGDEIPLPHLEWNPADGMPQYAARGLTVVTTRVRRKGNRWKQVLRKVT